MGVLASRPSLSLSLSLSDTGIEDSLSVWEWLYSICPFGRRIRMRFERSCGAREGSDREMGYSLGKLLGLRLSNRDSVVVLGLGVGICLGSLLCCCLCVSYGWLVGPPGPPCPPPRESAGGKEDLTLLASSAAFLIMAEGITCRP